LGIRHYGNVTKTSSRTKTEQLKAKIDLHLQVEHTKKSRGSIPVQYAGDHVLATS
jgi:hypothetical protein